MTLTLSPTTVAPGGTINWTVHYDHPKGTCGTTGCGGGQAPSGAPSCPGGDAFVGIYGAGWTFFTVEPPGAAAFGRAHLSGPSADFCGTDASGTLRAVDPSGNPLTPGTWEVMSVDNGDGGTLDTTNFTVAGAPVATPPLPSSGGGGAPAAFTLPSTVAGLPTPIVLGAVGLGVLLLLRD